MTQSGFDPQRHKNILTKVLVNLAKNLQNKIGFKGGTAAMLFYDLPRLSMDLDFDLLVDLESKDKEKIIEVLSDQGEILEQEDKRWTLFYLLNYESGKPNIKVEFNTRVWEHNNYISKWLLGVELKLADKATIFTNKLVALSDRDQPVARDLYDVHFFSKMGFPLDEALIKERTDKNKQEFIDFTIDYIKQNYTSKKLLHGLAELVDDNQKSWIKDHLIDETVDLLSDLK